MLIAENIRVSTISRDSLTVAWQIRETPKDLSQYSLFVLRSDSDVGPWEVASPSISPADVYEFEDNRVNLFSKVREFYYRIRIVESGTGDTWEWGSVDPTEVIKGRPPGGVVMETLPDLEAVEAIRRFDLNLREYIGNRVVFLKRRRWGQRCPKCWDPLEQQRMRSSCITCFDTSWTGGYFAPQETLLMNVSDDVKQQLTPLLKLEVDDRLIWLNARPRALPEDVIIDVQGNRWRVISTNRNGKLGTTTRQTVQLRNLSRDQVEYQIPLRGFDIDTLGHAPHRQYLRSMDIDEYHTQAQRLGISENKPNQIRGFPMDIDEANS